MAGACRADVPCIATLQGHAHTVSSLAFAPDGALLASGSFDGTVRLWDTQTHRPAAKLEGHVGHQHVHSVAFAPDGALLASAGHDGTVRLWSAASRECVANLAGHTNQVLLAVFSPDGALVASGGADRTVRLWSTATHQCVAMLQGHTDTIYGLCFSPDGALLASGSSDRTVRVWSLAHQRTVAVLQGHTQGERPVDFSPDGSLLAAAGDDHSVRLWSTATRQYTATLRGHSGDVHAAAFSPDGSLLATGSLDQTVRLWDTTTHECIAALRGHTMYVQTLAFAPGGTVLATGSCDNTVRLWDVPTRRCVAVLKGHTHYVCEMAFAPDGVTLATGSYDHTVRLWDTSLLCGHTTPPLRSPQQQAELQGLQDTLLTRRLQTAQVLAAHQERRLRLAEERDHRVGESQAVVERLMRELTAARQAVAELVTEWNLRLAEHDAVIQGALHDLHDLDTRLEQWKEHVARHGLTALPLQDVALLLQIWGVNAVSTETLLEQEVTGAVLAVLTDAEMASDLGMHRLGDRLRLAQAVRRLNEGGGVDRPQYAPDHPANWTPQQVLEWLDTQGLGEFRPAFEPHAVDGEGLMALTRAHLHAMNIGTLGARVRIQTALATLHPPAAN